MRVFGIDCGTEITGFGVVESDDGGARAAAQVPCHGRDPAGQDAGLARAPGSGVPGADREIERWRPDAVAIEEVFYSVNAKSALKLGQVRGVALLAAARHGIPVAEYAPLKIKSSVVGYGLAKKEQVQFMVARLLGLAELAATGRRGRCAGHRHLPHSYCADAGAAGDGAMRMQLLAVVLLACACAAHGQSARSCGGPSDSGGFLRSRTVAPAMDADLTPTEPDIFARRWAKPPAGGLKEIEVPGRGPRHPGERGVCRPRL